MYDYYFTKSSQKIQIAQMSEDNLTNYAGSLTKRRSAVKSTVRREERRSSGTRISNYICTDLREERARNWANKDECVRVCVCFV